MKYSLFKEISGASAQIIPLKMSETLMLSINTAVTVGAITKLTSNEAELSLKIPIVPFKNSKIGIARNINNHWRLIGYGEII